MPGPGRHLMGLRPRPAGVCSKGVGIWSPSVSRNPGRPASKWPGRRPFSQPADSSNSHSSTRLSTAAVFRRNGRSPPCHSTLVCDNRHMSLRINRIPRFKNECAVYDVLGEGNASTIVADISCQCFDCPPLALWDCSVASLLPFLERDVHALQLVDLRMAEKRNPGRFAILLAETQEKPFGQSFHTVVELDGVKHETRSFFELNRALRWLAGG